MTPLDLQRSIAAAATWPVGRSGSWTAERTIAWLAGYRRRRARYDRDSERFFAFAMLACDRLCHNRLPCAATARLP